MLSADSRLGLPVDRIDDLKQARCVSVFSTIAQNAYTKGCVQLAEVIHLQDSERLVTLVPTMAIISYILGLSD